MKLDEFRNNFNAVVRGGSDATVAAERPLRVRRIARRLGSLHQRMKSIRTPDALYDLVDEYVLYAARLAQALRTTPPGLSVAAPVVPEGSVLVWMAMRLLSLPALVCVLMMLVVEVQVLVFERVVHVFRLAGVVSRPQSQRRESRSQRHKPKHRHSNRQLERGSDPASEWVSEQPAGVR